MQSIRLHSGEGQSGPAPLARILYELTLRDSGDALATGQPQELGPEAYLNSTSQGELVLSQAEGRSEDAGGKIISAVAVTPRRDEICGLIFNEKLHIMDKFFWLDGLFHEDIGMNPVQILI
jgi:hypothetical protein